MSTAWKIIVPLLILLACGFGLSEAASPQAERIVLQLEPGKIVNAWSKHDFEVSDRIGVAAYVSGKELVVVGEHPLALAGRGVYVQVRAPRESPLAITAVGLRRVRVVVYMEW